MKKILNNYDDKLLKKIVKYYNISVINNNNDRDNLIKLIDDNLYLDKDNFLKKKDYENRYKLLKGMIINGNNNENIKEELNLF